MKLGTSLVILVAVLLTPLFALTASTAQAQDGVPITVTQPQPAKWDWGYLGLQPQIGLWLGDRFLTSTIENPAIGGWRPGTFKSDAILGGKVVLGVGSDKDWISTEFFLSMMREAYSGNRATDGLAITADQWIGKVGFNFIFEFVSMEAINNKGEVTREGRVGVSGFIGFYWLFFPDKTFDVELASAATNTRVDDDVLFTSVGLSFDIPLGSFFAITAFTKVEAYTYRLERLKEVPILNGIFGKDYDKDNYNFESVTEKLNYQFGGFLTFTPHFSTLGDHHWRFYGGITYIIMEKPLPDALIVSAGVNFGW